MNDPVGLTVSSLKYKFGTPRSFPIDVDGNSGVPGPEEINVSDDGGRGHRGGGGGGGGGRFPSWLIWIGLLVGFNVLSWVFDWGWVIY